MFDIQACTEFLTSIPGEQFGGATAREAVVANTVDILRAFGKPSWRRVKVVDPSSVLNAVLSLYKSSLDKGVELEKHLAVATSARESALMESEERLTRVNDVQHLLDSSLSKTKMLEEQLEQVSTLEQKCNTLQQLLDTKEGVIKRMEANLLMQKRALENSSETIKRLTTRLTENEKVPPNPNKRGAPVDDSVHHQKAKRRAIYLNSDSLSLITRNFKKGVLKAFAGGVSGNMGADGVMDFLTINGIINDSVVVSKSFKIHMEQYITLQNGSRAGLLDVWNKLSDDDIVVEMKEGLESLQGLRKRPSFLPTYDDVETTLENLGYITI